MRIKIYCMRIFIIKRTLYWHNIGKFLPFLLSFFTIQILQAPKPEKQVAN